MSRRLLIISVGAVLLVAILSWMLIFHEHPVDFNTQVKPILNKKCIVCHGGVKRQGDFSLLFRTDALSKAKSGKLPIIPGDPDHSEMIRRITLDDPEDRMPYKQPPLTKEEIGILRDWIKQGAKWGDHWAYVAVQAPVGKDRGIDDYIHEKLSKEHLSSSPEAPAATLLRRVCLDLTGLPPTPAQANAFLKDTRPDAYQRLVDTLLGSPRYGEKWAALWLDLARYADTKGYERDDGRAIWRYRDWLIHAFNADMPYDQFLTEQLAGDLLPHPTDAQLIATAFHRNTMTNDEGGTDNEEFRTAAVVDRVNTTWQALMGTTFACVQCHSHPYDPFRHDEYYQFMAFFNDTRDEDTYDDYPLLRQYSAADSLDIVKLSDWVSSKSGADRGKEIAWFLRTWQPSINSIQADQFVNSELADTKWLIFRNHAVARLHDVDLDQRDQLIYRYQGFVAGGVWTIHLDKPDGPVLQKIAVPVTRGWGIDVVNFPPPSGRHDLFFTYENPHLKVPNASGMQFDWFHFTHSLPGASGGKYADAGDHEYAGMKKLYDTLMRRSVPTTPIMMDNPGDMHRVTHVFEKGNWLVKGKAVEPATPRSLNPFPAAAPRNRLGLALWMTSRQNPLTARTLVNRVWEQLFGTGLVETLEDLGTQGAEPTHRELLDYLAWKFMTDDKWSIKKLLRSIVLSATYRQDSRVSPEQLGKDPYNKYYARGARVRLSAEEVRDQALAVSGVLVERLGGASVMPWQPKGIWLSPWNGEDWHKSNGEDQYRRALYTYWKRTAPYPSMMSFDGVAREVCTARRIRTNTPLQALTLLNDSVYLDASRHLAGMMLSAGGTGPAAGSAAEAIKKGYSSVVFHSIDGASLHALEGLYDTAYARYSHSPEKTREIVGSEGSYDKPSMAAMIVVANAILNLDEAITKN